NDTGFITANGLKVEVYDTVKTINHQNACYVRIIEGSIKTGDEVTCVVDKQRRFATSQNHSATHLLQKSLQEVLDDSVHQCGSFVNSQVLRFDFRYSGDINEDDIIKVESLVNEKIQQKNNASICNMDIKDAKKLGAMALFGEKYKDVVRVVTFGNSVEFCGGTHVKNTGDIKRFAIKSIESKGLNVYRIEAACDLNVESEMFEMIKPYNDEMIIILEKAKKIIEDAQNQGISLTFNANISNDKPVCYKDIISNKLEVINLRKAFVTLEKVYKEQLVNLELKKVKDIINTKMDGRYGEVVIMKTFNKDINVLKTMAAEICDKLSNGIVFMANVSDNKAVNYIARSSSNLKGKISMGALIKDVSLLSDGNGGGNDVFAQGGGNNIEKLDFIIEFVKSKIIEKE
ncbi:MAG: DHHA1 domain-containing protein, partial [Bacilli bacterium]